METVKNELTVLRVDENNLVYYETFDWLKLSKEVVVVMVLVVLVVIVMAIVMVVMV